MNAQDTLDLDQIVIRLIEVGHGHAAVPVVEQAVIELLESSSDDAGFELDDLLGHLRAGGQGHVADMILQGDLRYPGAART